MQNPLYRLHWIIERFGKSEEHFSFHKDDEVLGLFIKQVHDTNTDPNIRYKPQGAGCKVPAENGRIYDLVHNSNKLGFWDHELKSLQIA